MEITALSCQIWFHIIQVGTDYKISCFLSFIFPFDREMTTTLLYSRAERYWLGATQFQVFFLVYYSIF